MRMHQSDAIDGSTVRPLANTASRAKKPMSKSKKQKIRKQRMRLLWIATKIICKRLLMFIGLLFAYACTFGGMLGLILLMIQPETPWVYVILGVSIGYMFLVCNCRIFEYIGEKSGGRNNHHTLMC